MRVVVACVLGASLVLASCGTDTQSAAVPDVVMLSPAGTRQSAPSYSPDGTRITYWAPAGDATPNLQLWVANADMTSPLSLPVHSSGNGLRVIWSPDGSKLAASSNDFGAADVVVVPSTGGAATRVTRGSGLEIPSAWYPDGDRIAYYGTASGGTISSFVVSVSTGVSTPLVAGETRPYLGSPSPDGKHIAYFVVDGPKLTIWVADSVGENPRQLTTEGFEILSQFAEWSPDGKELLYESRRTGTSDLWVVPIDGGKPRQLTRNVRNDAEGVWSPDGKWVAFISDRGRQTDIWIVPSAGGEEQRVTDSPVEEFGPLTWRPGSNTLSFQEREQESGVWASNVADGVERRLTPDSLRVQWFNTSPDGTQLNIVIARGGGVADLAVLPIEGGTLRTLVTGGGTVVKPLWSPDGTKIVFESDRGGSADVWVVDVAAGAPRQLVNWPGYENSPGWSSDGSAVFFASDRGAKLWDIWKVLVSGGEPVRVTTGAGILGFTTRHGVAALFAGAVSSGGQIGLFRVDPIDGKLQPVWEKTNADPPHISPSGDSVSSMIEQPDGKPHSMVLASDGSGGRKVLNVGEEIGEWSPDGRFSLYTLRAGGATDLGLLNHRDGTTRRLRTTPQSESGAEFTSDGKFVVFRRSTMMQRISKVDVTSVLR